MHHFGKCIQGSQRNALQRIYLAAKACPSVSHKRSERPHARDSCGAKRKKPLFRERESLAIQEVEHANQLFAESLLRKSHAARLTGILRQSLPEVGVVAKPNHRLG